MSIDSQDRPKLLNLSSNIISAGTSSYELPDIPYTIYPRDMTRGEWLTSVAAIEMLREHWLRYKFWPIRNLVPVAFLDEASWQYLAVGLDPDMMSYLASVRNPARRRYFAVRLEALTPDVGIPEETVINLTTSVN